MQDFPIGRDAFIGVGVAVVLGLAVGAAVKPTIGELRRNPGGEMEAASYQTETVAKADPGWARYGSHLPSWVLGTDAQKAYQQAMAPAETAEAPEPIRAERAVEPMDVTTARYQERAAAATDYPSQSGDILPGREPRAGAPRMDELPSPEAPSD